MPPDTIREQLQIFFDKFHDESDRACVIFASAVIENALKQLLVNHLVPSNSNDDDFFNGAYAPLSSFKAKIDLAFRLGLLSLRFSRDLQSLRRLRNDFAHDPEGSSLRAASPRDRIRELCKSHNLVGEHSLHPFTQDDPKRLLMAVAGIMLFKLRSLADQATKLVSPQQEALYHPDTWALGGPTSKL